MNGEKVPRDIAIKHSTKRMMLRKHPIQQAALLSDSKSKQRLFIIGAKLPEKSMPNISITQVAAGSSEEIS